MNIVLLPRMSEKTYAQSTDAVFVFKVANDLNKHQIASAVENTYQVKVTEVRVLNQKGKKVQSYRNRKSEKGSRSDFKKAYVTLKQGDSIPIFAAVQEAEEKAEKAEKKAVKKNVRKEK